MNEGEREIQLREAVLKAIGEGARRFRDIKRAVDPEDKIWSRAVDKALQKLRIEGKIYYAVYGDGGWKLAGRNGVCCACGDASTEDVETPCPKREDGHCDHWWEEADAQ